MSGVIDEHGQWEHCGECNKFVLIQHLKYEPPSAEFKIGRSFCSACFINARIKKLAAWFALPLAERQRTKQP